MKTIYLVRKLNMYGNPPTIVRAYESRADAEELVAILNVVDIVGIEITELQYQPSRTYSRDPAPQPPVLQPNRLFGYNGDVVGDVVT